MEKDRAEGKVREKSRGMILWEQRGDCFDLTGITAEEKHCLLAIGLWVDRLLDRWNKDIRGWTNRIWSTASKWETAGTGNLAQGWKRKKTPSQQKRTFSIWRCSKHEWSRRCGVFFRSNWTEKCFSKKKKTAKQRKRINGKKNQEDMKGRTRHGAPPAEDFYVAGFAKAFKKWKSAHISQFMSVTCMGSSVPSTSRYSDRDPTEESHQVGQAPLSTGHRLHPIQPWVFILCVWLFNLHALWDNLLSYDTFPYPY